MERSDKNLVPERVQKDIKPDIYDGAHALISGGFSFIPAPFGSLFAALFGTVIYPPPITQRINQLMMDIVIDLNELQNRGQIKIQDLFDDPSFTSNLLYTIQIITRNHQKEHVMAIRNAILNSALKNPPEDDTRKIFFNLIDSLTAKHFILLAYFTEVTESDELADKLERNVEHKSAGAAPGSGGLEIKRFDLIEVMQYILQDISPNVPLYEQILRDMDSKGLIKMHSLDGMDPIKFDLISNGNSNNPSIKPFGKLLVSFIKSPLNEKKLF